MKTLYAIGGGSLQDKETIKIDEDIAARVYKNAGERRPNALFFSTASHDKRPYYNSFRKIYTSLLGMKCDVALLVYGEMPLERIKEKIALADLIYVGGGNTLYMLELWKKTGVDLMIKEAYESGKVLAGVSAGAICWFTKMYTDSDFDYSGAYSVVEGLDYVNGFMCPHYNSRREFDLVLKEGEEAYAVEDGAAIVFEDGVANKSVSSGGKVYSLTNANGEIIRTEI